MGSLGANGTFCCLLWLLILCVDKERGFEAEEAQGRWRKRTRRRRKKKRKPKGLGASVHVCMRV